jgi:enoyl-CoA hydratase/carnithine racemase
MAEPNAPLAVDPATLGFERVRYAKDASSGVATVTIDRPQVLNAFDFRTLRELGRAFEDASWDDTIATVVVTGAGDRAFCTGADLDEQAAMGATSGQYWRWMGAFIEMHDRLRNIGKPTVARINGICVGGGNELQMACDLGVIAGDAFIRHVGPEHGSVPAGGATQWLPIMVGDRRAREILLLCEEIAPAKALEWGLVNSAVPREELDAEVDRLVESLAAKLPQTVRYTKQQLNFWRDLSWHETVNHARDWLALSMATDEPREAVERFLRRKQ